MSVIHARPRPEAAAAAEDAPRLRREIGTVGLMFTSVGSIIGSGWLFGALTASTIAGPAALLSWVLGGAVMILLALIHAELGGAYPVAGGSARFPAYAFGSMVGFASGWFASSAPSRPRRSRSRPRSSTPRTTSRASPTRPTTSRC